MLAVIGIVNQEGRSIESKKGRDRIDTVIDTDGTKKIKQTKQQTTGPAFKIGLKTSLS